MAGEGVQALVVVVVRIDRGKGHSCNPTFHVRWL
jgi:hypothetical protein